MVNKIVATPTTNYQPSTTIFIVGPTASGKSGLAMQVARKFNGEIICADSQTIKRGLDIGTAKPSKQDQAEIEHHLIDIVEPYEPFSVAEFKARAEAIILDIQNRGKLPIVVGGSGLYIDALLYNFEFRPTTHGASRDELNKKSVPELQKMVLDKGLELPRNEGNPRHLIRTIESEGAKSQKGSIRVGAVVVGINPNKEVLEQRIIGRVKLMFDAGLVDETKSIIAKYGRVPKEFDAIGYLIVQRLIDGEINEQEARTLFVIAHRQYAKKQRSWFRRNSDIIWFETSNEAFEYIKKLI